MEEALARSRAARAAFQQAHYRTCVLTLTLTLTLTPSPSLCPRDCPRPLNFMLSHRVVKPPPNPTRIPSRGVPLLPPAPCALTPFRPCSAYPLGLTRPAESLSGGSLGGHPTIFPPKPRATKPREEEASGPSTTGSAPCGRKPLARSRAMAVQGVWTGQSCPKRERDRVSEDLTPSLCDSPSPHCI
jgi:hypothetical protein